MKSEYDNIVCFPTLPDQISSRPWRLRMSKSQNEDGDKDFREALPSEVEDQESSPRSFDIVTFPADFTLSGLVEKMKKNQILIPEFQRQYVWKQKQASRLIESFLLGLPVPPIFLFTRQDKKHLVIDGQQRLKSIAFFFSGAFPGGSSDGFRLIGLNEKSPYLDMTYSDLEANDQEAYDKLNDAVLRSFMVQQLQLTGDASIYHIFERLNTGGTSLVGQEIRNCIYHGPFNEMLLDLNYLRDKKKKISTEAKEAIAKWREILGKPKVDSRLRDVELILRFFALHFNLRNYEKPMKDFLSKYMDSVKDATNISTYENLFRDTVVAVHCALGPKPFHIHAGLNTAVYDSVFAAFASRKGDIPSDMTKRYAKLKKNEDYMKYVTAATTDDAVVPERIKLAKKILFGD